VKFRPRNLWLLACLAVCGVVSLMLGMSTTGSAHADLGNDTPYAAPVNTGSFVGVDVFIDSGDKKLAAYQVEITSDDAPGLALLAGVEGGEHAAFEIPPHYDPQALHPQDNAPSHIILAAFDVGNELPTGKTRVARLHVQWNGPANEQPRFGARLMASATIGGEKIDATVTLATTPQDKK